MADLSAAGAVIVLGPGNEGDKSNIEFWFPAVLADPALVAKNLGKDGQWRRAVNHNRVRALGQNIIMVGATEKSGKRWSGTTRGPYVDTWAPGAGVWVANSAHSPPIVDFYTYDGSNWPYEGTSYGKRRPPPCCAPVFACLC